MSLIDRNLRYLLSCHCVTLARWQISLEDLAPWTGIVPLNEQWSKAVKCLSGHHAANISNFFEFTKFHQSRTTGGSLWALLFSVLVKNDHLYLPGTIDGPKLSFTFCSFQAPSTESMFPLWRPLTIWQPRQNPRGSCPIVESLPWLNHLRKKNGRSTSARDDIQTRKLVPTRRNTKKNEKFKKHVSKILALGICWHAQNARNTRRSSAYLFGTVRTK